MSLPEVVSREEWLAARKELLVKEKELTRARDRLAADRRRLPMVRVDKAYVFEGPGGEVRLLDLFEGRRQLVLHHFMWTYDFDADGRRPPRGSAAELLGDCRRRRRADPPERAQHDAGRGVPRARTRTSRRSGSGWAGRPPGTRRPVATSTTTSTRRSTSGSHRCCSTIARRPSSKRAGLPWSPAMRGDWPGLSAFLRDGETVYHTYSTFARGIDLAGGDELYLDLTALGRQEAWEETKGRAGAALGDPCGRTRTALP